MQVKVLTGDIFKSDAQTIVNTVNCVGVMGKGVALGFKRRFPAMFEDYKARCDRKQVRLGQPYIYKDLMPPWVINFPTKHHWREVSNLSAIMEGLEWLQDHVRDWGVTSLASPPLGCGYGQLDWRAVGPVLYNGFQQLDIPVLLYAPHGTPKDQMQKAFLHRRVAVTSPSPAAPHNQVDAAFVAVLEAINRITLTRFYYPGSVEFHKMAYFATALGLPTELSFSRGSYGPFSNELKREVAKLIQNGLLVQEAKGDAIEHKAGPAYNLTSWKEPLTAWESEIEKLKDLFLRVQNARQAELFAAVHFSAMEAAKSSDDPASELEVLHAVQEWKRRKRDGFSEREIGDAIRLLNMLDWVQLRFSLELPVPQPAQIE